MKVRSAVLREMGAKGPYAESRPLEALNDFMLPLIKGYASEKVYELLSLSLQCYGGSGYCQDYPAEQYIRDQRIDSLYEGTTHIQALDLFFRKIGRDRGTTLQALVGQINTTLDGLPPELAVEKAALQAAIGDVQAIMMTMMPASSHSRFLSRRCMVLPLSGIAGGGAHQLFRRKIGAFELARHQAFAHDDGAVGHAEDFGKFG